MLAELLSGLVLGVLYTVGGVFILMYKGGKAVYDWYDEIKQERRNEMGYLVKSESVWGGWKLTKIRESDNYTTIHKIDDSGPTITITCGGYTVRKTLSQDGTLSFSIFDFPAALQSFDGVFTFKVHHDAWNLDWIIEAPAFTDPDAIRDWNILVDEQYDYMTRSQALFRLKPALGQNAYHDLFEKFMERKINRKDMRKMPTKIVVTPL